MDTPTLKSKNSPLTFWKRLQNTLGKIPSILLIGVIRLYRLIFSPSVGILRYLPFYPRPSCIFYPTCSEYGIACFQKYSFFTAFYKTIHRIGRCHPHNEPRVDLP